LAEKGHKGIDSFAGGNALGNIVGSWRVNPVRRIITVETLENYRVALAFDDGVSGIVDLSHLTGKGVFDAWRDPRFFEQVRIGTEGELAWGDRIDLCPDSLYLKVTRRTPEDIFPALRHERTHA
jgi:hypothetical protein